MQIRTFSIKKTGQVILTEVPDKGYMARFQEGDRVCPSAAGVGDTPAAALYHLGSQTYAASVRHDIKRLVFELPVNGQLH